MRKEFYSLKIEDKAMIDEEIKRLEHELAELFVKIGRKDAFGDPGITRIVRKLNKKVSEQKNTKSGYFQTEFDFEIHQENLS